MSHFKSHISEKAKLVSNVYSQKISPASCVKGKCNFWLMMDMVYTAIVGPHFVSIMRLEYPKAANAILVTEISSRGGEREMFFSSTIRHD